MANVDGDRLDHFVTVALVRETYEGWGYEDYQRARLRLHRVARDRLREFAIQSQREAD